MYHICFVYIYPLNGYWELNLFEEPCFTLVATITSLARELNPTGVGEDLALDNPQELICHKTPSKQPNLINVSQQSDP